MLEGHDILCFGPGDWWHMNPSCTQHIIRRLAVRNRVLYVNPFSSDLPARVSRGLARRVCRKARSILGCLRRESSTLHTFSPVFLPWQGNRTIDMLNNCTIRAQVRGVCKLLGMKPTIAWFENPRAAEALEWFPEAVSLYHVSDLFAECPYTRDRAALQRREARLTRDCDVVVCVSEALHAAKAKLRNGAVRLLPHGVDFQRFRAAAQAGEPPPELRGIQRPIAGYYGTLTAHNDIELLEYCATGAPDISFVFAGTITGGDYRRLQALANVHFLGQVPYERIPALAAGFDVCLLAWRMSEWIRHSNPLKFLEYMASGRPIVSVPIPQVVALAEGLVSVAATPDDFRRAIRWELSNPDAARAARRIEIAARHDWGQHVETLSGFIIDALAAKGK